MAKNLSMEDMIKKFQYLRANPPKSSKTDSNQNTQENNRIFDRDVSKYSKSSTSSYDESMPTARSLLSNAHLDSSTTSSGEESCKVCMDAEANCALIECGHIVACLNCAKLLTRCPVCRETIKRTLRIYKS